MVLLNSPGANSCKAKESGEKSKSETAAGPVSLIGGAVELVTFSDIFTVAKETRYGDILFGVALRIEEIVTKQVLPFAIGTLHRFVMGFFI